MDKIITQRSKTSRRAGQAVVEYALILALVAIVIIVALAIFGSSVSKTYKTVINALQGNNTQQIITDMNARMQDYFNRRGRWPRTFSPYNFTDIGLTPGDWSQPINGLYFSPHGSEVGIANKSGDNIEVYAKDLNGNTLHLNNGWSIWCPAYRESCYYHTVASGNEVDPASIYATGY